MNTMAEKVCAIIGYGPGLGASYATTFAGAGYNLALLSRSGSVPEEKPGDVNVMSYSCNAGDPDAIRAELDTVERELGPVDVLIYNADIAQFGTLEEVSTEQFEASWRVGVLGLFSAAKHLAPQMIKRRSGTIIVSGATAALRGNLWTTAFASTKSAQRILAQSLAKQLGPKGIHVAYLVIDGVIDTTDTRQNFARGKPDEFFIQPRSISEMALMLVKQDQSAWTFELDLRPFGEIW